MRILAGDVGGTKTLLQLREYNAGAWEVRLEKRYESGAYPTFAALLQDFVAQSPNPIACGCFAVAGPVVGQRAYLTNLGWDIDADELARTVSLSRVLLINDFYAVAAGVPLLGPEDLVSVHAAERDRSSPIALLGAGTGLGEAVVVPTAAGWNVIASEGGHADFAPNDETQVQLYQFLRDRYGHVSYERVLSGPGLVDIYVFVSGQENSPPDAAQIARRAGEGDSVADRTMEIFMAVYAAEAGNIGLRSIARGGVFIAGGIAAKNIERFTDGRFARIFLEKGRMRHLMERIPVDVIINQKVGLIGAADLAARTAASL